MSHADVRSSGMVRVAVVSGARRADLVLPGSVPLAELVPGIARSMGLLDAESVYAGHRVVTVDGRVLGRDGDLESQGVVDGGLLIITAGVDEVVPRVYDDVVEAVADAVEHQLRPWDPASARRAALAAAGIAMALGAATLVLYTSDLSGVAACVVAAALVAGSVELSRVQHETAIAVSIAWMGVGYAGVGGLVLGLTHSGGHPDGLAVTGAGAAAGCAGLVALVGLGAGRTHLLPAFVGSLALLATGLAMRSPRFDLATVLTTVLVLVVMAGNVFPWLALGMVATDVDPLATTEAVDDIDVDPAGIDPARVGADVRTAHEILVAVAATVGLLLVSIAPLAVSLGLAGTLVAAVACLAVMLRTRQHRTGSEVLIGLTSGIAGLVAVALSLLVLHPAWQPRAAIVFAATGAVLLVATLVPAPPSPRRARLGDLAESAVLLALLPLLVLATGLLP